MPARGRPWRLDVGPRLPACLGATIPALGRVGAETVGEQVASRTAAAWLTGRIRSRAAWVASSWAIVDRSSRQPVSRLLGAYSFFSTSSWPSS